MGQAAYNLVTDAREIEPITSSRAMVSTALLFTFTSHYMFMAFLQFLRKDATLEMAYDMGRRLSLYGIAALLSTNFLQYGIYHAILAWLGLFNVVVIDAMILMRGVSERSRNIAISFYYAIIFVWFFGIVFFYLFNALNKN